ncbi:universal stress protein [Phycicoccus sp. 3266]|uniref:universal stress protein n=1 Tax=Phycicoccus sp. 3266 TaxID=2817751 RepID=UPI00285DB064|nr:universal stress protein [Phycicoccus sp. 3266]MDR6865007.1 nucleotide-binding universal stress UspA family protein [Phycicoccus sp. 3266]
MRSGSTVDEAVPAPVVVGYDGSAASRRAVRWAAHEAAARGTGLRVVVAADDPGVPGVRRTATRLAPLRLGDGHEAMSEAVALAESCQPGVTRGGVVRRGQPGGVLVDQSHTAQLVVVGCRGRIALPASESSTSLITASRAACPVVVVRGRVDTPRLDPVVVGVRVGDPVPSTVSCAVDVARRAGSPLVLACGWSADAGSLSRVPRPVPDRSGALATVVRDVQDHAGRSVERAAELAHRLAPGLSVRTEVLDTRAERALEGLSWGASVLVVGRGGTGPFPGLPLGRVTRSALEHAGCPVVVVPPDVPVEDVRA